MKLASKLRRVGTTNVSEILRAQTFGVIAYGKEVKKYDLLFISFLWISYPKRKGKQFPLRKYLLLFFADLDSAVFVKVN
jgi:hypothetical protein